MRVGADGKGERQNVDCKCHCSFVTPHHMQLATRCNRNPTATSLLSYSCTPGPSPRTKADAKALAQARSLRAQLSTRLAQPMQPRFSHRFFTGAQATVLAHVGGAAGEGVLG